jgi:hypothetical protein
MHVRIWEYQDKKYAAHKNRKWVLYIRVLSLGASSTEKTYRPALTKATLAFFLKQDGSPRRPATGGHTRYDTSLYE